MQFTPTCLLLVALVCGINARQIRINRYQTEVDEDSEAGVTARVREVQPTPYPAAGYRPGRAFDLPGEGAKDAEDAGTTTTELPYTTTTASYEVDGTTLFNEVPAEVNNDESAASEPNAPKAPYPPAGYRPRRPFNLPNENQLADDDSEVVEATTSTPLAPFTDAPATEVVPIAQPAPTLPKAPYPAAGYRPSRAFFLPTELVAAPSNNVNESVSTDNKADHPVCGVSVNPLAPKPPAGAKEDPDAERVFVQEAVGPAIVTAPLPTIVPLAIRAQPLIAQPIVIAGRPFAYSAQVQTW